MQFLLGIVTAILTAFLALSNMLADGITELLSLETVVPEEELSVNIEESGVNELNRLDSQYEEGDALPDILIENAAYQGATVIGSMQHQSEPAADVRDALVNIFCTHETENEIRSNSGSGFFINDDGVILTNAHVAQFLLLENITSGSSTCEVRVGDPAVARYEAELLYISPAWVQKHAYLIDSDEPRGTGERDFALLFVTAGLENQPLPGRFPYLAVNTELLPKSRIGDRVTVAGYPAGQFFRDGNASGIEAVVATTRLTDMFTFGSNYADVISIGRSTAGQRGISGGPVLDEHGEVIGLVSTKGSNEEGTQTLRALTLSYIDRSITSESSFDLAATASGQLAFRAQLFMETIVPFLSRVLEAELE